MSLHKVKDFRCYQPVRIGQEMISYYIADDTKASNRCSKEHDAFFCPALNSMILKKKACGTEKYVPLTNIQDFSLQKQLIELTKPAAEESEDDLVTEDVPVKDTHATGGESAAQDPAKRIAELKAKAKRLTKAEKAELAELEASVGGQAVEISKKKKAK